MDLPPKLYKYTRRIYAAQMLIDGLAWINTLHNLRNEDKYGLEIGDKEEGIQKTHMRGKIIDGHKPETIPPTIRRLQAEGRIKGLGNLTVMEDINENTNNLYVYSLTINHKLQSKFSKESVNYDTLIEITYPIAFINALTVGINNSNPSIKQCHFQKILYYNREQEFENQTKTHPVFVKGPRHSWQEEFRLVWIADNSDIIPRSFKCPNLKDYINIIKL